MPNCTPLVVQDWNDRVWASRVCARCSDLGVVELGRLGLFDGLMMLTTVVGYCRSMLD